MLAWFTQKERSQKIDDLPVLATCQSGTLVMLSSEVNGPVAHGSTQQYLMWLIEAMTNLKQTFQACHLWTFNAVAIFGPSLWRITLCHDRAQLSIGYYIACCIN